MVQQAYVKGKLVPVKREGGKWVPVKQAPAKTPAKAPTKKKEQTPFQKLAAERGVDPQAIQKEVTGKLKSGESLKDVGKSKTSSAKTSSSLPPDTMRIMPDKGIYDATTGTYTDPQGQQFSMGQDPTLGNLAKEWANPSPEDIAWREKASSVMLPALTPEEERNQIIRNMIGVGALAVAGGIVAAAPLIATGASTGATVGTGWIIGGSTASTLATNTVTKAGTASLLGKIVAIGGGAVGLLMASVGTYPFAGFIKEEALQTLGFAVRTAINNNDIEGAERAVALQEEILNPDALARFYEKIPFKNVLDQLKDFFGAAGIKLAVDKKVIEDMKAAQEGETGEERDNRIGDEILATQKAVTDYRSEVRRRDFEFEAAAIAAAQAATREEDKKAWEEQGRFWAKEAAKQRELEAEDRKAIADFWFEYRKRIQELSENSRPSNLNFGLI